ncbi:UDP-N-acetylglucosamine-N-acetylmuramylpentapeptide N-acetylglucosamine transferase [Thermoactinomyces sp. DSM 45891]|uniref:undecaprenyldiphospho-muramoylpentapeptide beta-N-acetylglucosaminyltransferase n=1 Tax=Thermoactinomyces sp. DSM 45891 TaxID=1761907 RepID=UPI00091EAEDE|nr:undecaprenyldiphospho-muramoylpentapeptide beta-N-acetylglucosaminyltransferase [Thermoactinomyces sp. DSM 45891]SFX12359.1 UDP-N-acetylglucosamine-N-acetylmuramylpentapeptide N-acetylglucosamine transferase [Thermoactinomyces sp. DSM 45891]
MKKKKVLFTGGGTAGHVTVNLALIPKFQEDQWEVSYIGSYDGIERELIGKLENVPYEPVTTGKLRRYFDLKNIKDPFKVLQGIWEAYRKIRKLKPDVIFSKGGFVSVPVVLGGWMNRVPILIHESDLTPGLANKIAMPFANKVCTTFAETMKHIKGNKGEYLGAVVREELFSGDRKRGLILCDFVSSKPVLLVMGGSMGSQKINQVVRENLDALLPTYQIVHITGKGAMDQSLLRKPGYRQFEYVSWELPDLIAMADLVVSRAGSNSIFEFASLHKPMLLIPLSRAASRGDQILNASLFEKQGIAEVLMEEDLANESFLDAITSTWVKRDQLIENMKAQKLTCTAREVAEMIQSFAK